MNYFKLSFVFLLIGIINSQTMMMGPPPTDGKPTMGMDGMMMGGMMGGMGGMPELNGVKTSTECPSVTSCAEGGSSNYIKRNLTYNPETGIFTGAITTNFCSNYQRWGDFNGTHFGGHSPNCKIITVPLPDYINGKKAAPLRGTVGLSIGGGLNIYGPFEAGFVLGQACTNNKGECKAGLDVDICEAQLAYQCGKENLKPMFMDSCGGHANPYHIHKDLGCEYDHTVKGHSVLVGIALDGRGIYGLYEDNPKLPELDSCNGHYGDVPAFTLDGVNYPASKNVYHYHTSMNPPFTIGCLGPVSNINECKGFYSTCGKDYTDVQITETCKLEYDTDCPCFSSKKTIKQWIDESCYGKKSNTTSTDDNKSYYITFTLFVFLGLLIDF